MSGIHFARYLINHFWRVLLSTVSAGRYFSSFCQSTVFDTYPVNSFCPASIQVFCQAFSEPFLKFIGQTISTLQSFCKKIKHTAKHFYCLTCHSFLQDKLVIHFCKAISHLFLAGKQLTLCNAFVDNVLQHNSI